MYISGSYFEDEIKYANNLSQCLVHSRYTMECEYYYEFITQ